MYTMKLNKLNLRTDLGGGNFIDRDQKQPTIRKVGHLTGGTSDIRKYSLFQRKDSSI